MKSQVLHLTHCSCGLVLAFLALHAMGAFAGTQSSAVSPTEQEFNSSTTGDAPSASLALDVDKSRPAAVMFDFNSRLEQQFNFPKVLSTALGCQLQNLELSRDDENANTSLYAECALPARQSLMTRINTIDLSAFKDISNAEPNFSLFLTLSVRSYDSAHCEPAPQHVANKSGTTTCFYFFQDLAHAPAVLQFEFGYSRAHAMRVTAILGFFLLIPIACTFWFRHRATRISEEAKPTVFFAYRRFLTWTALFGTLAWWATVDLLHADEFAGFLLPSWQWIDAFAAAIAPWFVVWTPPLVVYFLCLALSSPIQSLRGTKYTQKQILNRSFWAVGRLVLPLLFICFGIVELFHSPSLSVLLIALGIVAGKFANRRFIRAYGVELHALTSGELRDRAFAMAEKAKTKLNQLYVIPTEHMRMANAFAHVAHNVLLTDYLVKNMSKAEVDAVVGHEIAHLRNKHIGRRMTVTFIAVLAFAFGAGFLEYWLPRGLPNGPIFYAIVLVALLFVSRRNEFAADAGSVKLTGNAEGMMTALTRLTRLNTVPMQWGKLDEKLLTHPSTLRRIRKLAKLGGISEARTAELLTQSLAPPLETYAIPASALPGGKLFSTGYKSRLAAKVGWTIILTTTLLPAAVAFIADWAKLENEARWLAYALGLLFTLAANLALLNFLPMLGLRKMECLLRQKCQGEDPTPGVCGGLFVSLVPSSEPLIYEGNWAWDLGFLSVTSEHLCFWGEEARFTLRRSEITSLSVGAGPIGWFRNRSVQVAWRGSDGQESTFNLRPMRAHSMWVMAAHTRLLARELQSWLQGLPLSGELTLGSTRTAEQKFSPPSFGNVTGTSPQTRVRGQFLVRDFLVNSFIALGAILVFKLGFPAFDDLRSRSDSALMTPSSSSLYVFVVVWLARVFVLLPYWRSRRKSSSSGKQLSAQVG